MNVRALVGPVRSRLDTVPPSSRAALLARFTIPVKNAHFARRSRPGWDGAIRYFAADGSFLGGFLPEVAEILEAGGYRVAYEDRRTRPPRRRLGPCTVKLRDYQAALVDDVLATGPRCTVKAATGSGKTECAIVLAHRLGVRALFLVPTVDLATQTRDRFARALPRARIGLLTGTTHRSSSGTVKIDDTDASDVVVANVQGLSAKVRVRQRAFVRDRSQGFTMGHDPTSGRAWKLGPFTAAGLRFLATFGLVVGDEVHLLNSPEWSKLLEKCPAPYRVGMSATPESDDPCRDALLVGHFGEVVGEVTQTFLRDAGHSAPVTVRILPYAKPVKLATPSWPRQHAEGIVRNRARNDAITDRVIRDSREGFSCLVIVDRYEHAREIGAPLNGEHVLWHFVSGANRKHRAATLDAFRSGRVKVIVSTSVFNQGIDLKEIDRLFVAAGGASERLAVQRGGRLVRFREGKDAVLYDLDDAGLYESSVPPDKRFLEVHFRNRIAAYRGEGFTVEGAER